MITWRKHTEHSWSGYAGNIPVMSVRRPIRLRWRPRGWSVDEVLGAHAFDCDYHGEDLEAAKADAEARLRVRLQQINEALAEKK